MEMEKGTQDETTELQPAPDQAEEEPKPLLVAKLLQKAKTEVRTSRRGECFGYRLLD